jgi:hypothetical protein
VFSECTSLTSGIIPNSATNIGEWAFAYCSNLTSVTIPNRVASIGQLAFFYCTSLTNVYFQGNAPTVDGAAGGADTTVFAGETGKVYYMPGTTGWTNTFGGWPTAQWFRPTPAILGVGNGLGVQGNRFNFTVSWATNTSVIIQACTNLANPVWTPIATNALSGGVVNFSDFTWTNAPGRFYRVSSQ